MRKGLEQLIVFLSWGSSFLLLAVFLSILGYLGYQGGETLSSSLLFGDVPTLDALLMRQPVFHGLFPAVVGTVALVLLSVTLALPVGIAAGIYMAEYSHGRTKWLLSLLFDVMAGLPSIVVGLAGFSLTLILHRLLPGRLGPCLLISALAIGFLILPYLIRSSQMALESLHLSLRYIAPALGATRLQNIRYVLLPACLPHILSGVILSIGRAAEDTAVIMLTGVVASAGLPRSLFEQFEALPFFIYYISSQYTDSDELRMGFGAAILLLAVCALLFTGASLIERTLCRRMQRL